MGNSKATLPLTKDMLDNAFKKFKKARSKRNSRLRSWEHCFAQFSAVLKDLKENKRTSADITSGEIDYLCLHLGFYLASWGMMRGSSKLLQHDYKIHENAVKCILEYNKLHEISLDELCKDEKSFNKLLKYIKSAYNWDISDTLLSKIILGTLGIVPAYDTSFKATLKKYNIASDKFGIESLKKLSRYFSDNFKNKINSYVERINKIADKEGCPHYTRAKIIDSILWFLGNEILQKENLPKLLDLLKKYIPEIEEFKEINDEGIKFVYNETTYRMTYDSEEDMAIITCDKKKSVSGTFSNQGNGIWKFDFAENGESITISSKKAKNAKNVEELKKYLAALANANK